MWFVSPSFRDKEWLCEPYERDGKFYVKVMGAKTPREIRVYEEWQSQWPAALKPRVERYADKCLAFNYPEGRYAYVVGIDEINGRRGFWKYQKLPERHYNWQENIILSPLFGYIGLLSLPAAEELEPVYMDISEVEIEGGFKRLITDEWYKDELNRYRRLSEEIL